MHQRAMNTVFRVVVMLSVALIALGSVAIAGAQSAFEQTARLTHFQANDLIAPAPAPPTAPFPTSTRFREEASGTVTIARQADRVSLTVTGAELNPGHVDSVWWLFDHADVENPVPEIRFDLILNASGGVVGPSGDQTFAATLTAGDYLADFDGRPILIPGALRSPLAVTVGVVLKDHGPAAGVPDLDAGMQREDGAECPCFDPYIAVLSVAATPASLPAAGSGGLTDAATGSGASPLVWATLLASVAVVAQGVIVRRLRRRR